MKRDKKQMGSILQDMPDHGAVNQPHHDPLREDRNNPII